jgi:hypothetical protein
MRLLILIFVLSFSLKCEAQIIRANPFYIQKTMGVSLLLDTYTGAKVAVSLRKLRNAYTGSAVRVRRSSDNAEQDIGFNGANEIDTAVLKTFIGANTGYVVKWYDQSGNANDASQSTTTQQGAIVISGAVQRTNGKVSVYFDGDDAYNTATVSLNTYLYISAIFKASNNFIIAEHGPDAYDNGNGTGFFFFTDVLSSWLFSRSSAFYYCYGSNSWAGTNQVLTTLSNNSSGAAYYKNGVVQNNDIVTGSSLSNTSYTNNIYLWSRANTSVIISGYAQETIIWDKDMASDRAAVELNTNTFYSIY